MSDNGFAKSKLVMSHMYINLVFDLNLHSQLFRVYCYCIDLDHNLTLFVLYSFESYYW